MTKTTAVILGGGRGTRLFPLTYERAKPAVSFAGKYRLIDIPMSNCINSGIKRTFVLTQFLSASLHRHIMQTYQFDVFSNGFVDILAAEQTPQRSDWFQGTADAVRATLNHTMYYNPDQILILSGDHLYRMDYRELLGFHQKTNADITICVYPVTFAEAPQLGLLKVDESGIVREFREKPKERRVLEQFSAPRTIFEQKGLVFDEERCLASMGIYVFEREVMLKLLEDQNNTDFGKDVIPSALDNFKVMAYPFGNYWKDIGTISSFFEANISLAQAEPPFELYFPDWPIYTRTRSLPPSRVIQSKIRDSLLVEGSDIVGAHINNSIIGMRATVRKGTEFHNVVMMGADFFDGEQEQIEMKNPKKAVPALGIGKKCYIENAIIDKNARIGDGVVIKSKKTEKDYQGEYFWLCDGITVIPKGAIIPPGTEL